MNDIPNATQNASGTAHGTRSEHVPRAREPLLSTEEPTSSLSAAQTSRRTEEAFTSRIRAINELDALTRIVLTLRPSWSPRDVRLALERDDRAWTVIAAAAVLGAADPDVNHPNGLRYVGPGYTGQPTPVPMSLDDWRRAERCKNGAIIQASGHCCALCRAGIEVDA
jgi:hypothetical protein